MTISLRRTGVPVGIPGASLQALGLFAGNQSLSGETIAKGWYDAQSNVGAAVCGAFARAVQGKEISVT